MIEFVTLYKSLSPVQLAQVVASGWKAFPVSEPDQRVFAPKLHREYAEMLARQLEMANYQAGYVVMFKLKREFAEQFECETIGYREHEEYRIPVSALGRLNDAIVGRIELISGFAALAGENWQAIGVSQYVGYH